MDPSPYPPEKVENDVPLSISVEPPPYTESLVPGAPPPQFDDEKGPALPPRPSLTPDPEEHGEQTQDGKTVKKKPSFNERMYNFSNRVAKPVNKFTNRLGSEGWWPTTLDIECDKCARILRSFVKDGAYTDAEDTPSPGHATTPGPKQNKWVNPRVGKIPQAVIARAKGIAIFTTFRTGGPYLGGMSGSGVVLARLPDGSWSPPCGILPNALSVGFMAGLDIYDCVCVLNTQEAVDAFSTKARFSLGGSLGVAAGPVGAGATLESDFKKAKPVWSYARSRGFYVGGHVDGVVVVTRPDANGAFYGEKGITAGRILKGDVRDQEGLAEDGSRTWPEGGRRLMAVVKDAGGMEADEGLIQEVEEGIQREQNKGEETEEAAEEEKKEKRRSWFKTK